MDMEKRITDPTKIKGWGLDANPKNDPTYPMKDRNDGEHEGYTWERPPQQPVSVEVLHSNERPNVAAVFGTSTPPAGLSGVIRRAAFKYSENSYAHWLPLMLADRIGMVEGVVEDLSRGHVPNVFGEMGWKAEWKHNRKSLVTRIAVGTIIAGAAIALLRRGGDGDDARSKKGAAPTTRRRPPSRGRQTPPERGALTPAPHKRPLP